MLFLIENVFIESQINFIFGQDNYSSSKIEVIKWVHFQKYHAKQDQLLFVLLGEIFGIAVQTGLFTDPLQNYSLFYTEW